MRIVLIAVGLAGCSFTPGSIPAVKDAPVVQDVVIDTPIDAPPDAPPPNFHLHVEADIDGLSHLIFKGNSVHWHHYWFAAPGREGTSNIPTKLDAVDWQPVWPNAGENRDCNCDSQPYTSLPVGIPRALSTTTLSNLVKRNAITVVDAPSLANDYTLEIAFDDRGPSGSDIYEVDIDVIVSP